MLVQRFNIIADETDNEQVLVASIYNPTFKITAILGPRSGVGCERLLARIGLLPASDRMRVKPFHAASKRGGCHLFIGL